MAEFVDFALFFLVYAFCGWLLEFAYGSIAAGELTNKGFLHGPFSLIYGAGAIIILLTADYILGSLRFNPLVSLSITVLLSVVPLTLLEYVTALVYEEAFGIKPWDYRSEAFNLHGRICLKYSLLWGLLAFILLAVVHPLVKYPLGAIRPGLKSVLVLFFLIYLAVDNYLSIRERIG